jgi:undecaprenyl-diphosphatase
MTENSPASEDAPTRTGRAALVAVFDKLRQAGMSRVKAIHTALGLTLTIGLALAVLLLYGFAKLTEAVLEGETLAFDRAIMNWMHERRAGWLDTAAIELTALGSMGVLLVVGLTLTVFLWHLEKRRHVAMIWFGVIGSVALNGVLKHIFGRDRPDVFEPLIKVGFLSFPSGHAMNSMVFYTVVGYAIAHTVGPGITRKATYATAGFVIALIGFTRVYLGVHYPSDVLGGFAAGFAWAVMCAALTEAWGKRLAASTQATPAEQKL